MRIIFAIFVYKCINMTSMHLYTNSPNGPLMVPVNYNALLIIFGGKWLVLCVRMCVFVRLNVPVTHSYTM